MSGDDGAGDGDVAAPADERAGEDGDGAGDGPADGVEVLAERRTDRWRGLVGATVAAAVLAVLARSGGLLLVAGLGSIAAAYASVASPPPVAVALDREFEPVEPSVGETVTVRLTISNVGDRTIPDLRLADGVPDGVRVTDGEARIATALRPGAATTLEYRISAGATRRSFAPATVAVRDVVGLAERRARVPARDDGLAWPSLAPEAALSLLPQPLGPVGPLATEEGGEGLAFHSVREHRAGDPLRRIDWRRRAKTGELATVEFEREKSATVVVVVDARPAAALAPAAGRESAIERGVAAAGALLSGIEEAGHRVGLAALGPAECWVPPGRGATHRERLQRALTDGGGLASRARTSSAGSDGGTADANGERTTDGDGDGATRSPALTATDGGGDTDAGAAGLDDLLARVGAADSVVLLSPLCDEGAAAVARRLAARAGRLSVLSPDPTAADSPGRRLVRLERRERCRALRAAGIELIDWPADRSLEHLLAGLEGRR